MSDQAGKKLCPHCKSEVDPQATRCPKCQGKIYVWDLKKKLLLGAIFLVIIGAVISSDSSSTPQISPEQKIVQLKEHALSSFSRAYIEKILKSPSTAKFSYSPNITQDPKDKNLFEIVSYVDSQNGFGAMIRSNWSIKARYVGGDDENSIETGENWKIEEVYFDGEKMK